MSEAADNTESQQLDVAVEVSGNDEDSLDNFFKKKDKKGKKKKTKKSEKGLAGDDKETSKIKKKESELKKDPENAKDEGKTAVDQEEWIDFEDESQRDYSDLKIQNMQINDQVSGQGTAEAPEYDETGELIPPKENAGPWNKTTKTIQEPTVTHEAPKPVVVVEEPVKRPGAYRPPQARSGTPSALPKRGRKQQAPEISNEMDFPSLSAASEDTIVHQGFEVVKAGGKSSTPWRSQHQQAKASEIKLGNQFAALNTGH